MQRRTIAFLCAPLIVAACGGNDPPPPSAPTPVPTTFAVTPTPVHLSARQTVALTPTVLDQTGARMDMPILWGSSDPAVVTVDDTGQAVAVGPGAAIVWARTAFQVAAVPVRVFGPIEVEVRTDGTGAMEGGSCIYTLEVSASGGAPGDSATLAPSAVEVLGGAGAITTLEVDATQMLDRFGALVLRAGDTLTSHPIRVTSAGPTVVNRIRYTVGGELRSARVPVTCGGTTGAGGSAPD